MDTGSARPPRRAGPWRWILRIAAGVAIAELCLLLGLWLLPGPPEALPDPDLAPPPPRNSAANQGQQAQGDASQGWVALDAILARRLELAAQQRGLDPAPLLPAAELRAAALAAPQPDSAAVQELLAAYRQSYAQLGLPTELLEQAAEGTGYQ